MQKKQYLSFNNRRRLASWVEAKLDTFKTEKPTNVEVALMASDSLKFSVSSSHINALRRTLKISWPRRGPSGPRVSSALRNGKILRLSRSLAKVLVEVYGSCPEQVLQDAEITAHELQSLTVEQLLESAVDLKEQTERNGQTP